MGAEQQMQMASMKEKPEAPQIDLAPIQDALKQIMDYANAPVEIVRGADGRAAGIRRGGVTKSINRGPDGRDTGIQ